MGPNVVKEEYGALLDNRAGDKTEFENDAVSVQMPFTEEERWSRIVQNDMENIPITIILMWIAVIVNGDNTVNIIMASLFCFGRIMHSICYIYRLMPWRSIGWLFGFIGTIGFMVNAIYGAFK